MTRQKKSRKVGRRADLGRDRTESQPTAAPTRGPATPSQRAAVQTSRRPIVWPLGLTPARAAVLLGTITALAFANAAHDVLVVDDASFPPRPETVSIASLFQLFREDAWASARLTTNVYRPLALTILQLESLVGGTNLRSYHLTIIAAHVAATLMVFALLRELLAQWTPVTTDSAPQSLLPAWIAALAFGVHPIHTEAVNSVFNGSEVFATLGVLVSLWLIATRHHRPPWATWAAVCASYFAALLCKESAVTLPALALLVLLPAKPGRDQAWWQRFLPLGWLLAPLTAVAILRWVALGSGDVSATRSAAQMGPTGWFDRLALLVTSFREFGRMIVWPHPLRASYDDYAANGILSAMLVLGLVVAIAIFAWRRAPAVSVGIAFFYVALLPLLPPLLMPHLIFVSFVAERYLYLPSVGAALAFAGMLRLLPENRYMFLWMASLAMCLLLMIVTVRRNAEWGSEVALWEAEVAAAPQNSGAWKWLTAAYMNARRLPDAAAACDRELPQHPSGTGLRLNCGQVYLAQGRQSDAEALYLRAVADTGSAV